MARLLSVRDIVSQAAMEIGISQGVVNAVVTSNDQDIIQMKSLLNSVADDLLLEEPYQVTLGDQVWIANTNGVPKPTITADTDLVLFDGRLAINGLKWKFLKAKGLEFGEEMRDYSSRLNKLAGLVNGRVLDLDLEESRQI